MLYLISYDLRVPGRDYETLYSAIKSFGTWWHYLDSTWFIKTDKPVDEVTDFLHEKMDQNDHFIVVDVTDKKRNGWLPTKAWDWLRNNDGQ